jgi:hypothetical protein
VDGLSGRPIPFAAPWRQTRRNLYSTLRREATSSRRLPTAVAQGGLCLSAQGIRLLAMGGCDQESHTSLGVRTYVGFSSKASICSGRMFPPSLARSLVSGVGFGWRRSGRISHPPTLGDLFSPTRSTDCFAIDYPGRAVSQRSTAALFLTKEAGGRFAAICDGCMTLSLWSLEAMARRSV